MDPITMYRLGKIQHQEYLDSCLRDQLGYEVLGGVSLWQRLRVLVSAAIARNERARYSTPMAPVGCSEVLPTSR